MTETARPSNDNEQHVCSVCGVNSDERVLINAENKGEQTWVCVRCLPTFIHGAQ
ncbi:hypothetical protein ACFLUG_00540 [Chloroflexota bacterium]